MKKVRENMWQFLAFSEVQPGAFLLWDEWAQAMFVAMRQDAERVDQWAGRMYDRLWEAMQEVPLSTP